MTLTKDKILADFNLFKRKAIYHSKKNNVDKAVCYSEVAAKIGYHFNFKYADDELENNTVQIGNQILGNKILFPGISNKIVFFDSFSMDNRGLTQQYLRAIISWNYDLLYITTAKKIGQQILAELHGYPQSQILILSDKSFKNNLLVAKDAIVRFKPEKAFLHFSPWEVLGVALWSHINSAEKFFINLTDHAFWLGKACMDYSLEFRKYGIHISLEERMISKEKLLFQPYFPINSNSVFKGFPVSTDKKIVAFAGSNYYKIYGENFLLLKLIKEVLNGNPNLIFLFAGSGDNKPIEKFIKSNNLEKSFILLGHRNDISEVIKNVDIYVNTYPMMGGLMSQYAAKTNKPIIGYSDESLYSFNDVEDLLGLESKELLVKKTTESFLRYFNELINDVEKRNENISFTKKGVLSDAEFIQSLKKTIEEKVCYSKVFDIRFDKTRIFETYLDVENNYLKNYNNILFSSLKHNMLFIKPLRFIKYNLKRINRKIFIS